MGLQRRCRGNRYCNFVGAFTPHRLLVLSASRQVVVGACWAESLEYPDEPKRFVCNRCAHRTLAYDGGGGPSRRVWKLCCPFDGEPLGRGSEALFFGGEVVRHFDHLPEQGQLAELIFSFFLTAPGAKPTSAYDLLGSAIERFQKGAYADALAVCEQIYELEPDHALALKIRSHCLDRLGCPEEARRARERIR